jgi:hypothetical protein
LRLHKPSLNVALSKASKDMQVANFMPFNMIIARMKTSARKSFKASSSLNVCIMRQGFIMTNNDGRGEREGKRERKRRCTV